MRYSTFLKGNLTLSVEKSEEGFAYMKAGKKWHNQQRPSYPPPHTAAATHTAEGSCRETAGDCSGNKEEMSKEAPGRIRMLHSSGGESAQRAGSLHVYYHLPENKEKILRTLFSKTLAPDYSPKTRFFCLNDNILQRLKTSVRFSRKGYNLNLQGWTHDSEVTVTCYSCWGCRYGS